MCSSPDGAARPVRLSGARSGQRRGDMLTVSVSGRLVDHVVVEFEIALGRSAGG